MRKDGKGMPCYGRFRDGEIHGEPCPSTSDPEGNQEWKLRPVLQHVHDGGQQRRHELHGGEDSGHEQTGV